MAEDLRLRHVILRLFLYHSVWLTHKATTCTCFINVAPQQIPGDYRRCKVTLFAHNHTICLGLCKGSDRYNQNIAKRISKKTKPFNSKLKELVKPYYHSSGIGLQFEEYPKIPKISSSKKAFKLVTQKTLHKNAPPNVSPSGACTLKLYSYTMK